MKKEEQVKILKSDLQQAVDGKLCMNVTQFANAFGVSRERAAQIAAELIGRVRAMPITTDTIIPIINGS